MEYPKTILGFKIKDIEAATCYLTIEGLEYLKPCDEALIMAESLEKFPLKVTTRKLREYSRYDVGFWLADDMKSGPTKWGWRRSSLFHSYNWPGTMQSYWKFLTLHLKAYIMKHGKRT